MSHIVTIQVEVKDFDAIKSACRRLGLKEPVHGRATIFETEIEGVLVELPDWIYPVVCLTDTGELKYDNYNEKWGDQKHLDRFVQTYCIEKATLEARRKGYSVTEQTLSDGSVKLTVNTGGVA
ncbi:MAG: DUF1257 domain-containing protein [Planctomycetaceae bacterium]|nr:DUF1257 domain-containing protein [Planctomycetaceae bacterium]